MLKKKNKSTRESVAIIDIDGTIADCTHRLYLIGKSPEQYLYEKENYSKHPDWDRFYELTQYDAPMEKNIRIIKKFLRRHSAKPVFVTGRNEITESDTRKFIERHTEEYGLYMREKEDRRKAFEIKRDHLKVLLKRYSVVAAFDDDKHCLEMYQEELKHLKPYGTEVFEALVHPTLGFSDGIICEGGCEMKGVDDLPKI